MAVIVNIHYYAPHVVQIVLMKNVYQFQLYWMCLDTTVNSSLNRQIRKVAMRFSHGCSRNLIGLNEWIARYSLILWRRLVYLDQNGFLNSAASQTLETIIMDSQ